MGLPVSQIVWAPCVFWPRVWGPTELPRSKSGAHKSGRIVSLPGGRRRLPGASVTWSPCSARKANWVAATYAQITVAFWCAGRRAKESDVWWKTCPTKRARDLASVSRASAGCAVRFFSRSIGGAPLDDFERIVRSVPPSFASPKEGRQRPGPGSGVTFVPR